MFSRQARASPARHLPSARSCAGGDDLFSIEEHKGLHPMNGFTLSGLFAKVAPSTRSHCSAKARHKRAFTTRLGIEALERLNKARIAAGRPIDISMRRPPGPPGFPRDSTPRPDTTDSAPIPGAAEEGRMTYRMGSSRVSLGNGRRIGLLVLGVIVLTWLPILGPPRTRRRSGGSGGSGTLPSTRSRSPPLARRSRRSRRTAAWRCWARPVVEGPRIRLTTAVTPGPWHSRPTACLSPSEVSSPTSSCTTPRRAEWGIPSGIAISEVKTLVISPDGRTLAASSSLDSDILLWDLAAGRERARLRGHESPVMSLAFAPDGRSLASGGRSDPAILLWDLAIGRPRRRLSLPRLPVEALAYSPDGDWLASTGLAERPVRLWDLKAGRLDRLIGSHSNTRNSVAFSPDGRLLATAGDDGIVPPVERRDRRGTASGRGARPIGSSGWRSRPTGNRWPPPEMTPTSGSITWPTSRVPRRILYRNRGRSRTPVPVAISAAREIARGDQLSFDGTEHRVGNADQMRALRRTGYTSGIVVEHDVEINVFEPGSVR